MEQVETQLQLQLLKIKTQSQVKVVPIPKISKLLSSKPVLQTITYMAERVVGTGSFGIVCQAKCLETGETVAIKKVLQDKRYKNRELQTMRILNHPNVVSLKHCFFILLIRMNCTLTWYWSMSHILFI